MDLSRLLAESLQKLRRDDGLTQEQFARRLGISRPTLTRLENADQNVTLKTLGQICRALRCRPGDLFEPAQGRLRTQGAPKDRGRRR